MDGLFKAQRAFYEGRSFSRLTFPLFVVTSLVAVLFERLWELVFPSIRPFDRATAETVLRQAGRLAPGARLADYAQTPLSKQGDIGRVERVDVTYAGGKTEKFVLKTLGLSFKEAVKSSLIRANVREHFSYTRLGNVPNVVPKSMFVTIGRAGKGQVLMPDFSHMRQVDNARGCSPADARLIMLELARLHGSTWANRDGLCIELVERCRDELHLTLSNYPSDFAKVCLCSV